VVETARLESVLALTGYEGSNPSFSAIHFRSPSHLIVRLLLSPAAYFFVRLGRIVVVFLDLLGSLCDWLREAGFEGLRVALLRALAHASQSKRSCSDRFAALASLLLRHSLKTPRRISSSDSFYRQHFPLTPIQAIIEECPSRSASSPFLQSPKDLKKKPRKTSMSLHGAISGLVTRKIQKLTLEYFV
jgi:hypothetical protein